jgi:hypothetical protein
MLQLLPYRTGLVVFLAGTLAAHAAPSTPGEDQQAREVGRTTERELKVLISSGVGTLLVRRGAPETIVVADADPSEKSPVDLQYAVRNRVGYLDVTLGEDAKSGERKNTGINVSGIHGGDWALRFSDAIPISFDVEQALGKADFDLTGLQVKDFILNAGAADVTVRFDEPNRVPIEDLTIESGVSKFRGLNLGNANFKRLRFNGGLGSYTLDFNGAIAGEVDVEVEVGLGSLTVIVPPEVGVRIIYDEGWLSTLSTDADIRKVGTAEHTSDNFTGAQGRINLRVDAGVGSVKVRRR